MRTLQMRILRMHAETAATRIGLFIREIENQIRWTTRLPWAAGTVDQRRFDGLQLLRQLPTIVALAQLDSAGTEQLKVSRLAMDVIASKADLSAEPKFAEAVAKKVYYSPVYFREYGPVNARVSEPSMTLSLAGTRRDFGVSVVVVNLKLIWDVVTGTRIGERGVAYILDAQGRVIAHPDMSMAQRNADLSSLAHVQAARAAGWQFTTKDARVKLKHLYPSI